MLVYDQPINRTSSSDRAATQPPLGFDVLALSRLHWGRRVAIVTAALLCAIVAVMIGKSLTPRYTATAQLYVDPASCSL